MDLSTIGKKVDKHRYTSVKMLVDDVQLVRHKQEE